MKPKKKIVEIKTVIDVGTIVIVAEILRHERGTQERNSDNAKDEIIAAVNRLKAEC